MVAEESHKGAKTQIHKENILVYLRDFESWWQRKARKLVFRIPGEDPWELMTEESHKGAKTPRSTKKNILVYLRGFESWWQRKRLEKAKDSQRILYYYSMKILKHQRVLLPLVLIILSYKQQSARLFNRIA